MDCDVTTALASLREAHAPRNDGSGAAIMLSVCSKHTTLVISYLKMDCDVTTTLASLRELYAPRNDGVR